MAFDIDIISIGGDFDVEINEAVQMLNGVQEQFRFSIPPERLSKWGRAYFQREYRADEVFKILLDYLAFARGGRRFVIGVIDQQLNSSTLGNLFGSHRAEQGVAVVTLRNWESY